MLETEIIKLRGTISDQFDLIKGLRTDFETLTSTVKRISDFASKISQNQSGITTEIDGIKTTNTDQDTDISRISQA